MKVELTPTWSVDKMGEENEITLRWDGEECATFGFDVAIKLADQIMAWDSRFSLNFHDEEGRKVLDTVVMGSLD